MNLDFEIDNLRWHLQNNGYDNNTAYLITAQATADIHATTVDILSNAAAEAVAYAESIGAYDFTGDIDFFDEGGLYIIRTKSGITDYSVDAIQNLPNLLKNADTAKDGSKYKVIPISKKTQQKVVGTSSADVMRAQQTAASEARLAILQNQADRSDRTAVIVDKFKQQIQNSMQKPSPTFSVGTGAVEFRTATSKHDATSQWVIPKKNRDMTGYLADMNDRIRSTTQQEVSQIVRRYRQEYT